MLTSMCFMHSTGISAHLSIKAIVAHQDSHYNDVIMSAMASQITSLRIVYSLVYSGANQSKHQSSASLAFMRGIHRWPVNSPHKGPVTRKMFQFDDVIMCQRSSIIDYALCGCSWNNSLTVPSWWCPLLLERPVTILVQLRRRAIIPISKMILEILPSKWQLYILKNITVFHSIHMCIQGQYESMV